MDYRCPYFRSANGFGISCQLMSLYLVFVPASSEFCFCFGTLHIINAYQKYVLLNKNYKVNPRPPSLYFRIWKMSGRDNSFG